MPPTQPRALIIRTAGTNCDAEMVRAFHLAGATPSLIHVDRLIANPTQLADFDLIGFPGGFSYGDDIASGRILAMKLREKLYPALRDAARRGVPMIGACNGFQVLVQVGLLPGPNGGSGASPGTRDAEWPEDAAPPQSTSLSFNASGRFIDRWVSITPNPNSPCIWTQGLNEAFVSSPSASEISNLKSDILRLPIAHGEGRFVTASPEVLQHLHDNNQVALTYSPNDNPNGSESNIAGICDPSGRIFGLMPHPERYLDWTMHPFWTRLDSSTRTGPTPGLMMFQNAVRAVQRVHA